MIELDGAYGEGGGALARTALALSALTGKEFKIINIRANRPEPGLKAQHVQSIEALKKICQAKTNEINIGSTELVFQPGKIKAGKYGIDIGTAGSISLLLQALILPSMFASNKMTLEISGGTCGKWQASVDYLQNVLLPDVQRFVEKIELKVWKRGYYPKGGGKISIEISPRFKIKDHNISSLYEELQFRVPKIILTTQGQLEQIRGIINISAELQEKEVGERIKKSAENSLRKLNVPINIRTDYSKTESIGGEVVLWALFSKEGKMDPDNPVILGSDALVEKGRTSEDIGKEAAEKLKEAISEGSPVDKHLADQLIPFMALLPGSEITVQEINKHTLTNIYVAEKFLPVGFKVEGNKISVMER
ncbi:RNA 3'-terminal phosphate cyclase [Candidatus Woesearchaeota archaeon]|nr:RNA 3'-terminal phosphate cyclase [Candidatus Woesearchaeota archaeon]